jgi:hypothetical protein
MITLAIPIMAVPLKAPAIVTPAVPIASPWYFIFYIHRTIYTSIIYKLVVRYMASANKKRIIEMLRITASKHKEC